MHKQPINEKYVKPVNYSLDSQKISFDFLKSHLWSAADILRGSLDSSEYRQPVMTLLFLKRLNDTFEENAENLINKGINKKEAYNKRRHNFYRYFCCFYYESVDDMLNPVDLSNSFNKILRLT